MARYRIVSTGRKTFHEWNGKCWKACEEGYVEHLIEHFTPDERVRDKAHIFKAIIDRVHVPASKLKPVRCYDDNGDILVNAANGVLRVNKKGITPEDHDPKKHFFTQVLPAAYDRAAKCEDYKKILAEVLPPEADRELIWNFGAYMFKPDCSLVVCLACIGPSKSGKSTVTGGFEAVLIDNPEEQALVTYYDPNDIANENHYAIEGMRKAVLNVTPDMSNKMIEDTGLLKAIISGEPNIGPQPAGKLEDGQRPGQAGHPVEQHTQDQRGHTGRLQSLPFRRIHQKVPRGRKFSESPPPGKRRDLHRDDQPPAEAYSNERNARGRRRKPEAEEEGGRKNHPAGNFSK